MDIIQHGQFLFVFFRRWACRVLPVPTSLAYDTFAPFVPLFTVSGAASASSQSQLCTSPCPCPEGFEYCCLSGTKQRAGSCEFRQHNAKKGGRTSSERRGVSAS